MTKLERLAYWKTIAGDTSGRLWMNEADDLYCFFQRFRPDGSGVERVFDNVHRGDEVLTRLMPFYQHTREGAQRDAYFVVRNPKVATSQELLELMARYLDKIRRMALIADADLQAEVNSLLSSIRIEIKQGQAPPHPVSPELNFATIYDTVSDWFRKLKPVASEVLLLKEAFYSMACDYSLARYITWPIYRESTDIQDPFAPAFDLWIRGAEFRFADDKLLTVYSPALQQ